MTSETRVSELTIRDAHREDIALILSFIRDLARYEKLLHQVVATEEKLLESLFGGRRAAEVILAEIKAEPVGFALFFHNYSTFLGQQGLYIEDLFVRPHVRGLGIGRAMFAHIARMAKDRGCGRLEWWVLDWNEPAIKFYQSLGSFPMSDWTVYRLTGQALDDLAAGK